MRNAKTKIEDVAKQAGVSKSTISNYLNGRFTNMSPKTRANIENAIKTLSYVPNITARRLSAKINCNVICLVIGFSFAETFQTTYYPTVMQRVDKVAAELGYRTLIYPRESNRRQADIDYLKGIASCMTDGFMLFDLNEDDTYFREFERSNIPYVCIGKYDRFDDYNYLATDHAGAVHQTVDYLVSLGHERIVILLEGGKSVVSAVRRRAFGEVMENHGLPVNSDCIIDINMKTVGLRQGSAEAITRALTQSSPTAMIIPGNAAYEVERIIRDDGKRVPEDISLVVLDLIKDSSSFHQRNYTHVQSQAANVSEKALRNLLAYLADPDVGFTSELVSTSLTIGKTTTAPRSK